LTVQLPKERLHVDEEKCTLPVPLWLQVIVPVGEVPLTVAVQVPREPTETEAGVHVTEVVVAGGSTVKTAGPITSAVPDVVCQMSAE
jgi:hypothetical protein